MENTAQENEEFKATDEMPVMFTESAVKAALNAIKEEGQEGDGLRVSVMGGGCSGLTYNLDFDQEERMGDLVLQFADLKVYLDAASISHLKGTTIDFVNGLNGAGFKFHNPNAVRTCGCGNSFN